MSHMPALSNPELIDIAELEARVDALEEGGGGGSVDGSGTTNAMTKWTDANTLGDSIGLRDDLVDNQIQCIVRMQITADLTTPGEDPCLKVVTNGTNIPSPPGFALDGGIQTFHAGSYDCTT